jgi:uncharacterized protein (DUF1810 family)
MPDPNDPFTLSRFVQAQAPVYAQALAEITAGRKRSHWMWFIFPQLAGLGASAMARHYAIRSRAEAQAYLAHPVLGPRLITCAQAALAIEHHAARDVFGTPDDLKLRSCATLFAEVSPPGSAARALFEGLLARYFDATPDPRTLALLEPRRSAPPER